jgi:hypothetical protein
LLRLARPHWHVDNSGSKASIRLTPNAPNERSNGLKCPAWRTKQGVATLAGLRLIKEAITMSGMNWRRSAYQISMRSRGSISLTDGRDRLKDDRAARWLNKRLGDPKQRTPEPATVAPSSIPAPRE